MNTEQLLSSSGETIEYAKIYVEQQVDYYRLESAKRIAKTTSDLFTVLTVFSLALMVILLASLSLGFFLGKIWDSYGLAFLFLTGLYATIALVIYFFKRQVITNPLTALIIKNMLD